MAAGRILTVRERVITTLQYRLRTITTANGYATDVKGVYRKDGNHIAAQNPPEIYLYMGAVRPSQKAGTEDRVYEELPVEIRFFAQAPRGLDREFNLFLGDIQRAVPSEKIGVLLDPFYVHGTIIFVPMGDAPYYSPAERGQLMGKVNYRMGYWRKLSDPRLWDDGDQFVREEQYAI